MNIWYTILLFLTMNFYVGASVPSVSTQQKPSMLTEKAMHSRINQFSKKFTRWKGSLRAEHKAYVHDLLHMYNELRTDYRTDARSATAQKRLLDCMSALDHIMNNWSSFYEQYTLVQQFHDRVVAWKKIQTSANLHTHKTALNLYTTVYNRYENEPDNSDYLHAVQQQQAILQGIVK